MDESVELLTSPTEYIIKPSEETQYIEPAIAYYSQLAIILSDFLKQYQLESQRELLNRTNISPEEAPEYALWVKQTLTKSFDEVDEDNGALQAALENIYQKNKLLNPEK